MLNYSVAELRNMRFLYTFAYEKQAKAAVLSKTAAFAEILTFCL